MFDTILKSLLPVLPYVFVALVLFILFAVVYLFRKFSGSREEAESARQAVELELSMFSKLLRLGRRKTDPVVAVEDPNKLTISRPIPAVPPPEKKS